VTVLSFDIAMLTTDFLFSILSAILNQTVMNLCVHCIWLNTYYILTQLLWYVIF